MHYWKLTGIYYGYPDCCSTWFVDRWEGRAEPELTPIQEEVEEGTGFIPCPSCAQKVKDNNTPLKDLIQNRICTEPYPHEGKDKERKLFIETIEAKLKPTLYEGSYIDVRDGIRYHVRFTYEMKDGEMVNEKELEAKELGRVL